MDIGFSPKFGVDSRVVGSLGLVADNHLAAAGRAVDSLLVVDKPVAVAADRMAEDATAVAGIPAVDSLAMAIDRIDRDNWFEGFGDNWQLDYVQMDYDHRSDNEDGVMVDDATTNKEQKKIVLWNLGWGYMRT